MVRNRRSPALNGTAAASSQYAAAGQHAASTATTSSSSSAPRAPHEHQGHAPHSPLFLSRQKHLPYLASYHGPWLSLPVEILMSLHAFNIELSSSSHKDSLSAARTSPAYCSSTSSACTISIAATSTRSDSFKTSVDSKLQSRFIKDRRRACPPIDPFTLQNIIAIRVLVDEASELVVKANNGGGSSLSSLLGIQAGNTMANRVSHVRQHRLYELAVSKLAKAYQIDEIATSVLTMQSASALEDAAIKVLKRNPTNLDAIYVNFFYEKIPSRSLAESTTTVALDRLLANFPTSLEFYRLRAMIHCFRSEFVASLRDFKAALSLAKQRQRSANSCQTAASSASSFILPLASKLMRKKGHIRNNTLFPSIHNTAEESKQWTAVREFDITNAPTILSTALYSSNVEVQLYFLRGACFHHYALSIIEKMAANVSKIAHTCTSTVKVARRAEKSLAEACKKDCSFAPSCHDKCGSHPISYDKSKNDSSCSSYLTEEEVQKMRLQVITLAKKSIRDYVTFLSHFDMEHTKRPLTSAKDTNVRGCRVVVDTGTRAVEGTGKSNRVCIPNYTPGMDYGDDNSHNSTTRGTSIRELPDFVKSVSTKVIEDEIEDDVFRTGKQSLGQPDVYVPSAKNAALECADAGLPLMLPTTGLSAPQQKSSSLPDTIVLDTCVGPSATYHPLLVESWFSIALNYLLLCEWPIAYEWHQKILEMQKLLDGYPVFLPPRSMSQADYVEVIRSLKSDLEKQERRQRHVYSSVRSLDEKSSAASSFQLHTKRADIILSWLRTGRFT